MHGRALLFGQEQKVFHIADDIAGLVLDNNAVSTAVGQGVCQVSSSGSKVSLF